MTATFDIKANNTQKPVNIVRDWLTSSCTKPVLKTTFVSTATLVDVYVGDWISA